MLSKYCFIVSFSFGGNQAGRYGDPHPRPPGLGQRRQTLAS
jgi:hypothetical protein